MSLILNFLTEISIIEGNPQTLPQKRIDDVEATSCVNITAIICPNNLCLIIICRLGTSVRSNSKFMKAGDGNSCLLNSAFTMKVAVWFRKDMNKNSEIGYTKERMLFYRLLWTWLIYEWLHLRLHGCSISGIHPFLPIL
jgi:hypothetical protein